MADAPQLLFGSAVTVDAQAAATFGAFVRAKLFPRGIQGMVLDDASFASLLDEIWNADANRYLRQGVGDRDRGHAPAGDATTATWCLYPDEWVYLPILEVQSPDWRIRRLTVSTQDAARTCALVAQFCLEQELVLPAVSGAPASDPTPATTPDVLGGYLYNSLLRRGLQSEFVYFYAAQPVVSNLDVPPSTPAGGVTTVNGRATPEWLPRFWHYIDRMRGVAQAHADNVRELHELTVGGRFVVAALGLLDKVLALYQRDCAPGPPPSVLESIGMLYSPDGGRTLDIDALRRVLPDLTNKARQALVDAPTWPAIAHCEATLDQLKALEKEDAFQEVYAQFDADRALYPKTAQAYQLATAHFVNARCIDPNGDPAVLALLKAFLGGVTGDSPITKEIALVFSGGGTPEAAQARDEASAIANLTAFSVGNTPGPSSLWVSLTRLGLVTSIGSFGPKAPGQTSSQWRASYRDYMERLAAASGITAAKLAELEKGAGITPNQQPGKLARAFAAAAAGAEMVSNKTQSGPWMTTGMGLLDLWGIYAGLKQLQDEKGGWVARGMDDAAIAQAGGGLAAAVVQVIVSPAVRTRCSTIASFFGASFRAGQGMAMFDWASKRLGPILGVYAGLYGVAEVAQGVTANGGVDWSKVGSGAGSFFQSAGYWADVLVTRQAKLFVTETAIEVAGVAVDAELLLGLGAAFNVAGIVIGLIVIAATHKDLVMKAAYALFTPGPQKWVDTVLDQLKVTKAIVTGSAALVTTGISQAQAASDHSTYVSWTFGPDTKTALQALGLGNDDLSLLQSVQYPLGIPAL